MKFKHSQLASIAMRRIIEKKELEELEFFEPDYDKRYSEVIKKNGDWYNLLNELITKYDKKLVLEVLDIYTKVFETNDVEFNDLDTDYGFGNDIEFIEVK